MTRRALASMPVFTALAGLALLAATGCEAARPPNGDPARGENAEAGESASGSRPPASTPPSADVLDDDEPSSDRQGKGTACQSGGVRELAFTDPVTVPGGVVGAEFLAPRGLVIDRTGTATVLYQTPGRDAVTASDPPQPNDPQDPSPGVRDTYAYDGNHLALEHTGHRTLAYLDASGEPTPTGPALSDLVIANQTPGAAWAETTRYADRGIQHVELEVNDTGEAALIWDEPGYTSGEERLYAAYRSSVDASWTEPQLLPVHDFIYFTATIDDDGRVLLVHDNWKRSPVRIFALRRSTGGKWSHPHLLRDRPGPPSLQTDRRYYRVTQSGNGAAVISHGPTVGDYEPSDRVYTTRMNPDGTWQSPVLQPHRLGLIGAAADAHGRTLLTSWDDGTIWARWSRRDGTWREPLPLVTGLDERLYDARWGKAPQVAVNRRGDALATWTTRRPTPTTWVRFQPARRAWTRPQQLPAGGEAQVTRAALGDCGHAAFAWTTPGHPRKLHLLRATASPNRG